MILNAENITKTFNVRPVNRWFKQAQTVLNGISLTVEQGECVGIIGESGSGKSTFSQIILGLEKPSSGEIYIEGQSFWKVNRATQKTLRRKMSVVFQNYVSSVNPRFTVKEMIEEPLLMEAHYSAKERLEKVKNMMQEVELEDHLMTRYAHELSGGQLQRVCIARALMTNPKLLILDEAISSLDVSIQLKILDLLQRLRHEYDLSYLFITHDLTAITYMCDRVYFFQSGQIVEEVKQMDELKNVQTDYAKTLLKAVLPIQMSEELTWKK